MSRILGIDIGGTGIKGAIVDAASLELLTERVKYGTPNGGFPEGIIETSKKIAEDLQWPADGTIGIGFPAIIRNGICCSAANISNEWLGMNLQTTFQDAFQRENVKVINDADAAGIAEISSDKDANFKGTVILLTIGTGIGSALFRDGRLVPNTEFGHLKFKDSIAEKFASNNTRKIHNLSWSQWGSQLNEVLQHIEFIFSPDTIILGGGVSKSLHLYQDYLKTQCPIVQAKLKNRAGIIGAAKAAFEHCTSGSII